VITVGRRHPIPHATGRQRVLAHDAGDPLVVDDLTLTLQCLRDASIPVGGKLGQHVLDQNAQVGIRPRTLQLVRSVGAPVERALATLAAAYMYGLCRNHAFRDGNKRVSFLSAVVFLELNGQSFEELTMRW
jgi:hypothetical protein